MAASRLRAYIGVALVGVGLLVLGLTPDLRLHIGHYLAFYAVAVAGYVLVLSAPRAADLRIVIAVALLVRLVMLPATPSLSDDYHRYLWDGRVQLAGINPYRYAPADPALDRVAYADRALINHPGVRTIYPPLAELVFAGDAVAHGGLLGLKLLFGAVDLLVAGLVALLAARERRREAATLWLLCPLVVVQTWHSAHLEVLAVALVVVSALLLVRRRDAWSGAALGLATALKVFPAFLLVPVLVGGRARLRRFAPAFLVALGLPYLPYLASGAALGSLRDTGARPEGNAPVFSLVHLVLPYEVARAVMVVAFAVGAVLIARRLPGRRQTVEAFAWTATLAILLLPIVHPWYWLTAIALAVAAGLRLPVLLGLAAPATDLSRVAGVPRRAWVTAVVYSPLAVWLAWRLGRRGRRSPPPPPETPQAAVRRTPSQGAD
jgi:hypothetical protein